jgi:hypothetical protein
MYNAIKHLCSKIELVHFHVVTMILLDLNSIDEAPNIL